MNCLLRTIAVALALTALLSLVVILVQADTGGGPATVPATADGQSGDAGLLSVALVIGVLLLAFGVWIERLNRLVA